MEYSQQSTHVVNLGCEFGYAEVDINTRIHIKEEGLKSLNLPFNNHPPRIIKGSITLEGGIQFDITCLASRLKK